jgi:signal recognition particle receptor subunit beta
VGSAVSALEETRRLAQEHARPDLVERLGSTRRRLSAVEVTVAVVGEFKKGKSTLVNALVQRPICPVDADIVTAVPTVVTYGEQPGATAYERVEGETESVSRDLPWEAVAEAVAGRDGGAAVTTVEVRIPHRILRTGLRLLDTPGVGGLDSEHGQVTLGSLTGVDGVLFVTDASQELTAPEMEFLRRTLDRCPRAAVVVTKTDLHRAWPRITELDRAHLAAAGIDVPVLPVSSFLRLHAAGREDAAALNEESGYAAVVEFLAREVVQPTRARTASVAAHEVDLVAGQLARQTDAERIVVAEPTKAPAVVERLDAAHGRARALTSTSAGWQQLLSDGVQDLVADVEYDLQARLRRVLKDVRDLIDESDPRHTWTETGAWLRRQVAEAAVANRDLLVERADELTAAVAAAFTEASGEAVEVPLDLLTRSLDDMQLPSASSFSMPGGRLASIVVTARTTALLPMLAVSVGGALSAFIPPLALVGGTLVATTGLGAKLFRDEGRRQRDYRRQQAKAAASKFVDEAGFELNKATRDSLRRTQRLLRDEFHARALMVQASTAGALQAARRASTLDPDDRRRRSAELDAETARLGAVRSGLRALTTAGAAHG